MRRVILLLGILVILIAAAWYMFKPEGTTLQYRFAEIERGNVESTVSATGNLDAVRSVEVGTQVSGQVAEIHVDFNDQVKKGQLIARIDPSLLLLQVENAKANLQRAEAELLKAQQDFNRKNKLYETKVVTEEEYNAAEYALALAEANLTASKVDLTRAERNLAYTRIYAPVNGMVIERNVEVGQTVAASMSAPILFLIAEDLAKMEIEVAVDESDIGQIDDGQRVRFTVQAYPDDVFEGMVRQVRMQSTIQENIVNYTVVVDVNNDRGKLLPGMTATVDFLVEVVEDVYKVANTALRFSPPEDMMAEFMERRVARDTSEGRAAAMQGSAGAGSEAGGAVARGAAFAARAGGGFSPPADMARLWYLDENGELAMMRVRTGVSDGQATEITGPALEDGLQVLAGVSRVSVSEARDSANPFQQQESQRRGPPGIF